MSRFAGPIVVIRFLQVADTFWIDQLSADAVGAMSLAFPHIFLLISVAGGFTRVGSILVAQYTGAESEGSAGRVAGQTLSFVTPLAVVLSAIGYALTRDLLSLLPSQAETTERIVPFAASYVAVLFLGLPFLFGFFVFSALMHGYGDTKTPMRVMLVSVAMNVVLDSASSCTPSRSWPGGAGPASGSAWCSGTSSARSPRDCGSPVVRGRNG